MDAPQLRAFLVLGQRMLRDVDAILEGHEDVRLEVTVAGATAPTPLERSWIEGKSFDRVRAERAVSG